MEYSILEYLGVTFLFSCSFIFCIGIIGFILSDLDLMGTRFEKFFYMVNCFGDWLIRIAVALLVIVLFIGACYCAIIISHVIGMVV